MRKLVVAAAFYTNDGYYPEVLEGFDTRADSREATEKAKAANEVG